MPSTTSDTRSLSHRRERVNTHRPENTQTRARNEAIRRVQTDQRLTYGCRNFYQFLDQHFGWRNGLVCPKLRTLVLKYGLCRRSCQRWIARLRECGYLTTEPRNGRACRHHMTWTRPVAPEAADVSPQDLINASEVFTEAVERIAEPAPPPESRAVIIDPEMAEIAPKAPERECPDCHGTYYRTIVEYVRVGKTRHIREKRVLCRCG